MVWILLTIHVLLAKSEKPVVWRRWLSSYDKSILRTLEVFDVFFIRNLERNSRKLFLWVMSFPLDNTFMSGFCSCAICFFKLNLVLRYFCIIKLFSEGKTNFKRKENLIWSQSTASHGFVRTRSFHRTTFIRPGNKHKTERAETRRSST